MSLGAAEGFQRPVRGGGAFLSRDSRDLSRDLARFGPFDEAEIWSHDSFPNLICKNLDHSYNVTSPGAAR